MRYRHIQATALTIISVIIFGCASSQHSKRVKLQRVTYPISSEVYSILEADFQENYEIVKPIYFTGSIPSEPPGCLDWTNGILSSIKWEFQKGPNIFERNGLTKVKYASIKLSSDSLEVLNSEDNQKIIETVLGAIQDTITLTTKRQNQPE